MRKILVAALMAIMLLPTQAQTRYTFRHYSVNDGLSQNTVTAILQDKQGFLWFGTWDGLNKFDGHKFTAYKSHPGDQSQMSTNRIDFIYQDRQSYIWFQTYDGRIHRFDPRTETFMSLPESISVARIHNTEHQFVEAEDGVLWFITRQGVVRVGSDNKALQYTQYTPTDNQHKLAGTATNFIAIDQQHTIWIGTNDGLQHFTSADKSEIFRPSDMAQDNDFHTICVTDHVIWFGADRGKVWSYRVSNSSFDMLELPTQSAITDIADYEKKALIVTTENDGFIKYSLRDNIVSHYTTANSKEISSNEFYSVTLDSHGIAWLENKQHGILRYRCKDEDLKHMSLEVDNIHSYSVQRNHIIYEDVNGRLWLNLIGGGFCYYNRKDDALNYFFNNPQDSGRRFTNVVHAAFSDREGNLWLSTYGKGIELVSEIETPFEHYRLSQQATLTANEVRAAHQTRDGIILLSTKDGLTHVYDKHSKPLGLLSRTGGITNNAQQALTDMIYCVWEDKQHRLWLGSKGAGIIILTPTASTKTDHQYRLQRISTANGLKSNDVYSIAGNDGHVYVGTYGGGVNFIDLEGNTYRINQQMVKDYPASCNKVRCVMIDNENILWVGTTDGLLQIDDANTCYHYQRIAGDSTSLSNNDVHCVLQNRDGSIFVGTFGGGLCKIMRKSTPKQKAQFHAFTTAQGMANDIVLAIVEDRNGNLWLSSENSVSRFDVDTETIQNFKPQDNNSVTFSEGTGTMLRLGFDSAGDTQERAILFGSSNGYYIFWPNHLARPKDVPQIVFTDLLVNNQLVTPNTEQTPLKVSINYTTQLDLNYHQRSISLQWTGIDYEAPENILYAYYLEGFDKQWIYTQNMCSASYTNLLPGKYVLHVKSTNNDGIWCDNETLLYINAHPAPWATGWAYIFYILLSIGILYLIYYMFGKFNHLRNEMEIEQKVTEIKLRFFTNISHELRTPLSLIKGPVDNILNYERITPSVREQLSVVESNTNRMLRMINQILDFRKIQAHKMRLKVQNTDIAALAQKTIENFRKEIEERNIDFVFADKTDGKAITWVDRDKIDIVLFNLLSNAFKFTEDGKQISVVIESRNNFLYMRVKDQGIGIKPALIDRLFDRFATAENVSQNNVRGTGIGLNMVKEIVDLHKGYIEVESQEGKGSQFSVLLRYGKDHFVRSETDFIVDDQSIDGQERTNDAPAEPKHIDDLPTGKELPKMVVVEDNVDMCKFIRHSFHRQFDVYLAFDGVEGEKLICEIMPDIVITDLMMPTEDGLTMLKKLKQNSDTCHIPVIVLTAKEFDETRLEALRAGADDYITKPFSPAILDARITNIMQQRLRLQEKFRRNLLSLTPEQRQDISPDEAFLAKLMNVMERNMDNNSLTVDELVSEMALGRTVFFNKIKSLTGLSPVEFIREIRIKRAAQLLEDGKYNITEITYMVGMNDSRYFSKCFKAVYGMTPSEYKKQQQQTTKKQ